MGEKTWDEEGCACPFTRRCRRRVFRAAPKGQVNIERKEKISGGQHETEREEKEAGGATHFILPISSRASRKRPGYGNNHPGEDINNAEGKGN